MGKASRDPKRMQSEVSNLDKRTRESGMELRQMKEKRDNLKVFSEEVTKERMIKIVNLKTLPHFSILSCFYPNR